MVLFCGPQCQKKLVDACDMLQFGYMPGSQVPDANPLIRELVKRNEDGFFSTKCFLHSFHKHAETMVLPEPTPPRSFCLFSACCGCADAECCVAAWSALLCGRAMQTPGPTTHHEAQL